MSSLNYDRKIELVIFGKNAAISVQGLKISIQIAKSDTESPNRATIKIYNLNEQTRAQIGKEFTEIQINAGYVSNFGLIFSGNIINVRHGSDGVERWTEIEAGDGDALYNNTVISKTISAGATGDRVIAEVSGIQQSGLTSQKLHRGKVLHGKPSHIIRQTAQTSGKRWSIQDGVVVVLSDKATIGEAVVLNSSSGLVGVPEQTKDGIAFKCLVNPQLRINSLVKISEAEVQRSKAQTGEALATIATDGFYKIIKMDFSLDSRGQDWYQICVGVDI